MSQLFQFSVDGICAYRLDDVAAGVHRQCVAGILGIPGDENEVTLGIQLLDFFGQGQTVDSTHMDIQKGDIAAVGL